MSPRAAADRLVRRLTYALNDYRTIGLEGHLAFSAFACGAWVLARGFAKRTLLSVFPDALVGGLIAGHGLLYLHVLLAELRPMVPRTPANRKLCLRGAVFSVFLWATLFISFVLGPPRISLAIPLTFANMIGALWAATRLELMKALDRD